jgi:hypothetical protein
MAKRGMGREGRRREGSYVYNLLLKSIFVLIKTLSSVGIHMPQDIYRKNKAIHCFEK